MSQQFIQPVTEAIVHVFDVLFAMPVEVGTRAPALAGDRDADLVGSVVLSGVISCGLSGTISLCLPESTARRLVGLLKGREVGDDECDALRDATGELAEMLAGSVKSRLSPAGTTMSCARVVDGGERIIREDGQSRVVLPCMCECGAFGVEISGRLHVEPRAGVTIGSGSGF